MEHFIEIIALLRHWYINPNDKSNKYKCSLTKALMEHFLQGNVPLRHLLNAKSPFMSWRRSAFNEVNDWALRYPNLHHSQLNKNDERTIHAYNFMTVVHRKIFPNKNLSNYLNEFYIRTIHIIQHDLGKVTWLFAICTSLHWY